MRRDGKKEYWQSEEVEQAFRRILGKQLKIIPSFHFNSPDPEYYLTPMKDVEDIVYDTSVDFKQYRENVGDCDDFSFALQWAFLKHAWKDGRRRASHTTGRVWGMLPHGHAINWCFTKEEDKIYFIEPQTDEIYLPRLSDTEIWFASIGAG